jgi:hypothetical protein
MRIEVYYHCQLSGERLPPTDYPVSLMHFQMDALKRSGLADAADEIHICVNGGDSDALSACSLAPSKSILHVHREPSSTELPTLNVLRNSLKPDTAVLYHHIKGVTKPGDPLWDAWRGCMERACVWNWRQCHDLLSHGYDSVGCHWLTPERFPGTVTSPFWGGNFWWARSDYLARLPGLAADRWENRYEAESWSGRGIPRPAVMDFHPQWPGMGCAQT